MAAPRRPVGSSDSRIAPPSPRGIASARHAELAARQDREAGESSNDVLDADGALAADDADDDDDDDEEVTTQVFEVELSGGSSPWATAFLECASEGDSATLTKLLDDGKVDLNDVDVDGFTALMIASAEAQNEVAMELLRRGADVSIRTHEMRSTALHFAAKSGAAQVVAAICEQDPQRVDAQNLDGDTPLVWACTEGRVDAVRVLLDHNANVNVVSHRAMSALICAVMLREDDGSDDDSNEFEDVAASDGDRAEIVRLLLRRNHKLVNYQDRDGSTAMHLAASHGYIECVKALLEFGADITLRNAIGQTPLEEAEETGIKATSGKCVVYLREIWKRLEEEAAARMMAMLEMEESSAQSTQARTKKTNKKKQKKIKQRRTTKANISPANLEEKAKHEKGNSSSGEGSSGDEADVNRVIAQTLGGGSERQVSEDLGSGEHIEDELPDAVQDGVWTTVGRKHNQYLSQRASAVSSAVNANDVENENCRGITRGPHEKKLTDYPMSESLQPTSEPCDDGRVSSLSAKQSPQPSDMKLTEQHLLSPKVAPAQGKQSTTQVTTNTREAQTTRPLNPPSPTRQSTSHPMNSPFSTFQTVHSSNRLYERYSRSTDVSAEAVNRFHGNTTATGIDVAFTLWRGSSIQRGLNIPLSIGQTTPHSLDHVSAQVANNASSGAIWRYTSPTVQAPYDRSSGFSNRRWAWTDRPGVRTPDAALDQVLRSLSCGLCGELTVENLQCQSKNQANGEKCYQLYCVTCLARAQGLREGTNVQCVKCRSTLDSRTMQRNDFARGQAVALASSTSQHFPQHLHRDYAQMRALMNSTSDRVQAADIDPFYLVPGANLSSLSVGQLDALEEVHLAALHAITRARVENARAVERLHFEEWLKTQRDVYQFSHQSPPT